MNKIEVSIQRIADADGTRVRLAKRCIDGSYYIQEYIFSKINMQQNHLHDVELILKTTLNGLGLDIKSDYEG